MCQDCPVVDPAFNDVMTEQYRTTIAGKIDHINELLKICSRLEDQYRHIGFFFHTTQYYAREALYKKLQYADGLDEVEAAFELETPEEYDTYFATFASCIQRLIALRSNLQYTSSTGTLEHLIHAVIYEADPEMDDISQLVEAEQKRQVRLTTTVNSIRLQNVYEDSFRDDDETRPWYTRIWNQDRGGASLYNEAEEWVSFLDWVKVLPETRRLVAEGQNDEEIAKSWLWYRNDGVIPGRLLRIGNA